MKAELQSSRTTQNSLRDGHNTKIRVSVHGVCMCVAYICTHNTYICMYICMYVCTYLSGSLAKVLASSFPEKA